MLPLGQPPATQGCCTLGNVASETETKLLFDLILLNLNGYMELVATVIDSTDLEDLTPMEPKDIALNVQRLSSHLEKQTSSATRLVRGLLLRNR